MPGWELSTVKLRLRKRSKFGAMSGCVPSTPVSITPTRTARLPWSWRYEPCGVAPMSCMSHCRPPSGSPLTGFGRGPLPWKLPPSDSTSRHAGFSLGAWPMAWLAATPNSADLASALVANAGSLAWTVATPTSVFSLTIVPPASRIACWAAAVLAPSW
jgi:hypothetical protein